jgi:hypothetical protein
MAKVGRPLIEIDWKEFDKLCGLQCTQEDIADFFECSVDTISRAVKREKGKSFAEYFALKKKKGQISLRRMQWKLAETSVAMSIWLGKQYLDQREPLAGSAQDENAEVESLKPLVELLRIDRDRNN